MRILVTGGAGGIGSIVAKKLIRKGEKVFVFDLKNNKNLNFANKNKNINFIWGDIRKFEDIKKAIKNIDLVIHIAFVLQPESEIDTKYSRDVNVNGTKNLIDSINEENPKIKLIFISSTTIYGITKDEKPPILKEHEIKPVVEYSRHKAECEAIIKKNIKNFVILRFSEVGHFQFSWSDFEYMYRLPYNQRTEFLHAEDAATAIINSIYSNKVLRKILVISGGKQNQFYHYDRIKLVYNVAYGLNPPPKKKFTNKPYPLDWYDTSESQNLLNYQSKTIYDYANDIKKNLVFNPKIIKFFAPIIELFIYNVILSQIFKLIFNYYYEHQE